MNNSEKGKLFCQTGQAYYLSYVIQQLYATLVLACTHMQNYSSSTIIIGHNSGTPEDEYAYIRTQKYRTVNIYAYEIGLC